MAWHGAGEKILNIYIYIYIERYIMGFIWVSYGFNVGFDMVCSLVGACHRRELHAPI